jgi:hypothetical protein
MWYPTVNDAGGGMTFRQYLNDALRDLGDSTIYSQHLKSRLIEEFKNGSLNPSFGNKLTTEDFDRIANTIVPVTYDGLPDRSTFPLLLHIHANGALHQSIMMEYLASHGYVVMSISMYNTSPAHYGRGEEGSNALLSQVDDLAHLIRVARNFEFIDHDKIAAIGMLSQAGLALQMKERYLSAIACLDCQLNDKMMTKLPFYSAESITIPVLHLVNTQFQNQGNGYLDSLIYSERYVYRFKEFPHSDFYPFPKIANPNRSTTYTNYEFVTESTLHFLNAFLKSRPDEKQVLLEPNRPGYVAAHMLAAREPLMTENDFLTKIRFGDMQAVKQVWAKHPEFRESITKQNFFSVVLFLCRDGEQHAFDALKMYTSAYKGDPRNEMLFKMLSSAYMKRPEDAAGVFEEYHRHFPDSPLALEGIITTSQLMGNKAKAKSAAQDLIDLVNRMKVEEPEKLRLLEVAEKVMKKK